jgi:hypothetical protein
VSSTVQPDVYELVWRQFKRTSIHEVLLSIWTADLKTWEDSINKGRSLFPTAKVSTWQDLIIDPIFAGRSAYDPMHPGRSPYYHKPDNNRFYNVGFPLPEQGGILHPWSDELRLRIFMDDLFLCPECGAFHSIQKRWAEISWLDYEEGRTDVDAMFRAIERRRDSKEFNFRVCEDRDYCKKKAAMFQADFERENTLERERIAWAAKVKEMEQRAFVAPKPPEKVVEYNAEAERRRNRFVYLIGCNDYVKIGIATNVKKRFSSLQTASPTPLKLLKSWQCNDASTQEFRLHQKYKSFRQKGEWFRLSDPVLNDLLAIDDLDGFFQS